MITFTTFITTFISSYFGVAWFERWSRKRELLDIPNDRSSHEVPTPRGAGLVIVAICIAIYVASALTFSGGLAWSYLFGAISIAAVSWLDDLRSVSFIVRLFVHSIAAIAVIVELGYWDSFQLPVILGKTELGALGIPITFLWIVWVVNAYNFMDGIDGIAGVQALATSAGWLVIGLLFDNFEFALYSTAVLGASLGFLIHNWQPAKVFMGDVGSAFLGFTFAVFPFLAFDGKTDLSAFAPFIAILMLWPFLLDTVITFFRRVWRRDKVWTPHRDHLYQQMIKNGHNHSFVSKLYGVSASLIVVSVIVAVNFQGAYVIASILITAFVTVSLLALGRAKKALT